jgi:hypothetical protein
MFYVSPNDTRGGEVILCDYCSNASHCKCAGLTRIPSGRFTCSPCVTAQVAAIDKMPARVAIVASIIAGTKISAAAPVVVKFVRTAFRQIKQNKLDRRLAKVLVRNELPQLRDVPNFGSRSVQDRRLRFVLTNGTHCLPHPWKLTWLLSGGIPLGSFRR